MKIGNTFFHILSLAILIILGDLSASNAQSRRETEKMLKGTWVYKPSSSSQYLKYIKASKLEENQRGFIFSDSGKVLIQHELGCQMPYPNFIRTKGSWKVESNKKVMIDRKYPGEKHDRMIIKKITKSRLVFTWE